METPVPVDKKTTLGWREWLALPFLNIPAIKAKIDTGARTSALHVFELEPYQENGTQYVRFGLHPLQHRTDITVYGTAPVVDQRIVRDSGGHQENRYVIETPVRVGADEWPIELTLTNREDMLFRMLLGRTAMRGHLLVDPARAYIMGRRLRSAYKKK